MSIGMETAPAVGLEERRLGALLRAAHRRARRLERPVLASAVLPVEARDPLACFAAAPPGERTLWSCPSEGYEMAAVGAAWRISGAGAARFAEVGRAWRALCADALIDGAGDTGTGPVLLGGFAFDPLRPRTPLWGDFPDALLTLPRYLVTRAGATAWLTVSALIAPDAPPPDPERLLAPIVGLLDRASGERRAPAVESPLAVEDALPEGAWRGIVAESIGRMRRDGLEKVVLARECRVRAARPFDRAAALARLREDYPGCFTFAFDHGAACFLGATPERLVTLRHGTVWATCLAGSIARGATPEDDRRLGEALLASAKDRLEHAIVVRALRDALADSCEHLTVPEAPTLLKVRNVQHLFTPVVGTAAPGLTALDLAARLHPTPAVGGAPREAALALIREIERLDRGWYAGPVGWLDARGDGEFAVALRSGLVRGAEASLFAGCGIVPDSDPEREDAESRLKLRPMLAALRNAAGC
jgi:isochorismate synthase